jgi:peptidoglycan/xylan/chitin deacetylase (PgdA/CDA1 family)
VLSTITTVNLLPRSADVAVGGQLAISQGSDAPASDQGAPAETPPSNAWPPAAVAVAVGPHLSVPILYYHYIRTIAQTPQKQLGFNLSISPGLFAEQMALLHVEGAHTITLATLMQALAGRVALPPHPVVLTFDDGYADFATTAEPIMARFGFVATDFVVSGFLGTRSYMTAAQVVQMDADGMVIGSHTVHHVDLARASAADAQAEIDGGKATLERLLQHPVLDFAYPYGGFSPTVVALVQQAGFRDAVATMWGDAQALDGPYLLHRIEIGGTPSLVTFARDAGLPLPTSWQSSLIASLATPSPKNA